MIRFQKNPNFHREVERPALIQAAELVAHEADALAKRSMPRHKSGPFEVQVDGHEVIVINTDHGGHLIEFGSKNNPPYAPLRRGVRAAGFRLNES